MRVDYPTLRGTVKRLDSRYALVPAKTPGAMRQYDLRLPQVIGPHYHGPDESRVLREPRRPMAIPTPGTRWSSHRTGIDDTRYVGDPVCLLSTCVKKGASRPGTRLGRLLSACQLPAHGHEPTRRQSVAAEADSARQRRVSSGSSPTSLHHHPATPLAALILSHMERPFDPKSLLPEHPLSSNCRIAVLATGVVPHRLTQPHAKS